MTNLLKEGLPKQRGWEGSPHVVHFLTFLPPSTSQLLNSSRGQRTRESSGVSCPAYREEQDKVKNKSEGEQKVKVLVAQLYLLLCNHMDCSRLLCLWDFPGKNPGVDCRLLLQGIFVTQGSNPHLLCLLHCCGFFTISTTREA